MQENDYKKAADIAIRNLERLLEFQKASLERWKNSEYCYTDIGKEIIETYQHLILEVQSEIEVYEQYKRTGILISRQVREAFKRVKSSKEEDDRDL